MKVYLLHGFNVKDGGKNTIDHLIEPLTNAGHEVVEIDYGRLLRVRVRLLNEPIARVIAATVTPGSILIGHSNGATLAWMAAKFGAPVSKIFLINPALDRDAELPGVPVVCYHSPSDKVTWLAKFIPGSPWGSAGRNGLIGSINYNLEAIVGDEVGHSDALWNPLFHSHLVGLING